MHFFRLLILASLSLYLRAQTSPLPLKAVLVLPKELCVQKVVSGNLWSGKETFDFGARFCPAVQQMLATSFTSYETRATLPAPGQVTTGLVLQTKLIDADVTRTMTAFGKRHMLVLVEWKITSPQGNLVWIQTVEGKMEQTSGNMYTFRKNQRKLFAGVIADLIQNSQLAITSAPELRQRGTSRPTVQQE